MSFFDLFLEAAKKGIKAMIWYGFMTKNDRKDIHRVIKEKAENHKNDNLFCIEVFLRNIREDTVLFNPGIVGSGIITCNLYCKSNEKAYNLAKELELIYKDSIVFDGYGGDLRVEKIGY
jgi:23S rRNA (adenine2030-N6)-methyltransferase